jgi:hypothetical protein
MRRKHRCPALCVQWQVEAEPAAVEREEQGQAERHPQAQRLRELLWV